MLARSWLFVPCNSERRLKKAESLDADIIIYDLEDAVALEEKEKARMACVKALADSDKNVVVRVNSMDTPYFNEDVRALFQNRFPALKGIMLPKAADAEQIKEMESLMERYEQQTGAKGELEIIPLIESALGLHNSFEIAKASTRIRRLAFGAVDYALDVNVKISNDGKELLYARSQLVNSSRAAGIGSPVDTVYVDFNNKEGMAAESKKAHHIGFGGKLVIHPGQIAIVNAEFSPSQQEIQESAEILEAVERMGGSAFQLNGKMVDEPIIKKARKITEAAKLLENLKNIEGADKNERR